MNITALDIYLFGLLGNLEKVFSISVAATTVVGTFTLIASPILFEEGDRRVLMKCIKGFALAAAFAFLGLFVPNQKTYAAMVLLPRIQESEIIKRDFPLLYQAARDHLLSTVTPKKEEREKD